LRSGTPGGFGAPAAPQPPVALVRNDKNHKITGDQSVVRSGNEIRVVTERDQVALSVSEMNKDSWLVLELPGFANADTGTELDSIDAVRASNETAYFKGDNALWVKLIVPADPEPPVRPTLMQTSITVSR
jgi:hypothetical protein